MATQEQLKVHFGAIIIKARKHRKLDLVFHLAGIWRAIAGK